MSRSSNPTTGLYVGSTIAPSWQDRIAVGDLGHRANAEISRYEKGILVERTGESTIWIPQERIRAVRTERGLAGKVMTQGRSAGGALGTADRNRDRHRVPRRRQDGLPGMGAVSDG